LRKIQINFPTFFERWCFFLLPSWFSVSTTMQRTYSLQFRRRAVELLNKLEEEKKVSINGVDIRSVSHLARELDVKNESTLRSWKSKEWTKTATKDRLASRSWLSKLDADQNEELLCWVLKQNEEHKEVTIEKIIGRFILKSFELKTKTCED
jgi:transposase-like protein